MSWFEFPHTRTYDSDLGWIIANMKQNIDAIKWLQRYAETHEPEYEELKEKVDALVNGLVDVIEPWDSSIEYPIYSIVSYQGENYIAIRPVPVGAMITNEYYWQVANTVVEQINAIGVITAALQKTTEWYATPQQYGAVADGETDDTAAIQSAIDSGKDFVFLYGEYLTSEPIVIDNKQIIVMQGGRINYTGTGSAIVIKNTDNRLSCYFDQIDATAAGANCVEFYASRFDADSGIRERNQYINIHFRVLNASNAALFFNLDHAAGGVATSVGWNNQINVYGGRLIGQYGIYADSKGYNKANNLSFYHCGFEGVVTGAYLANGVNRAMFFNCRYAESYTKIIETVGEVTNLAFIGTIYKGNDFTFSNQTNGYIVGVLPNATAYRIITNGIIKEARVAEHYQAPYDSANPPTLQTIANMVAGNYIVTTCANTIADTFCAYHVSVNAGGTLTVNALVEAAGAQAPLVGVDGTITKRTSTSATSIVVNIERLNT